MKYFLDKLLKWFIKEKWIFRWFRSPTIVIPNDIEINAPRPIIKPPEPIIMPNPREILYKTAFNCIGKDVTPKDEIPDEVDCADTVNTIHKMAFGDEIGGGASTYNLYHALLTRPDFAKVNSGLPGDIIISPTGYGNGKISNGHVGIVGLNNTIISNASSTGLVDIRFTIDTWIDRYVKIGGYPIYYFTKFK